MKLSNVKNGIIWQCNPNDLRLVNAGGHCQSEIAAVIFSSPRQTRRSFAMGRLKV